MPRMLYHDDPDWYERPGETVDIPLGPALTRSRSYVVPALPWHKQPRQTLPEQRSLDAQSIDPEALPLDQPATDLTGSH